MTRLSLAGTKNKLRNATNANDGTPPSSSSSASTPTHTPGSVHSRLYAQAGIGTPGARAGSGLNPLARRRRQTSGSADLGAGRHAP
jgi:hypothetical protein